MESMFHLLFNQWHHSVQLKNKMNIFDKNKNKGFTIVEAIVAIFILSISISAMLGLTVSSYSTAKYANNEITANYLLQEAIDSIRNSRDTAFQQKNWDGFKAKYADCFTSNNPNGCNISTSSFDPNPVYNSFKIQIRPCNDSPLFGTIKCPVLKYDPSGASLSFYGFSGTTDSNFKRQVIMSAISTDEIEITANVEYRNGTSVKTRSLKMYLLNWQAD